MQKIVPFLWFDKEAGEASKSYLDVFKDAKILSTRTLTDTPSGTVEIVEMSIWGQELTLMSAGPYFKITPAVSFMMNFDPSQMPDARARIDEVWKALSEGGKELMPLQAYPFSERYGCVQDRYGVSWQLILTKPEGEERPLVLPALLFVGDAYGKAEEATDFYISVFKDARRGAISRYPAGTEPNKEGTVMFTDLMLEGQWFAAMDGGGAHDFGFTEATSFVINCDSQAEADAFTEKLSAVPEAEQCGWLKDKFGLSWQVVPTEMHAYVYGPDKEGAARATQAMLKMKRIDVAALKAAYEGR
jgi:predicted 3-demethylubiquinone-9 3-methyltransferase (glyoxalase superfamily)